MEQVKGSALRPDQQRRALSMFVHRYTAEHRPAWVKDEAATPVQFASDREWLENTLFWVRKDGTISGRHHHCESSPTWPINPELRRI